ncbi:hypothetical protein BGZ52_000335 [Haplosporangium bisporale]|nr:hypothetical protein BGZ52_000335 [Haplosporangium bisporale]
MGTATQGHTAVHSIASSSTSSSSNLVSAMSNSHRSSLRAPSNNVRWPVNLNQLAAISLDDDSDLDRSLTDVSSQDIGSVKLLRMLKDSDDESTSVVPADTRLRRPRSVYSGLQQPSQRASTGLTRSSSQRRVDSKDSSIPKPQHRVSRADLKGLSGSSSTSSLLSQNGSLRSSSASGSAVRPPRTRLEQDESSQTHGAAPSRAKSGVPGTKFSASVTTSSISAAPTLQRPKTLSHSSSGSSLTPRPKTSLPTLSSSSSLASKASGSGPGSVIKQRSSIPPTKQESLLANPSNGSSHTDQDPCGTSSPTRLPGSPRGSLPLPAARSSTGSSQSRPTAKMSPTDNQLATAALPSSAVSEPVLSQQTDQQACFVVQVGALEDRKTTEEMAAAMISELTEELERWKTEVREYQQERVMVETWRKQISDLERDLEVALETLQTAEGKVIETEAEKDREIQARLAERQVIVDKLQAEVEKEKLEREKASQEQERSEQQKTKIEALESLIQDMDRKLSQAQQEIEQLEMQTVPAELQDVHQAHFQATQELEHVKGENLKLIKELSEEKSKVTQEQEESGNLLVKLSQLQETIANQLRDNNFLKDQLKRTKLNNQDHEKCQETAEASEYRHKNELERLQQQLQLQQTQLLQQQTEIMNLRAALEVEQKQSVMLLQQQSAIAAVSAPHFGRRVSLDGELNGSFLMIETSSAFNGGTGSNSSVGTLGDGSSMISAPHSLSASANASSFNTVGTVSATTPTMTHSNALLPPLSRNFENPSLVNQSSHSIGMNAALPPTSAGMSSNASIPAYTPLGGMASTSQQSGYEVEVKPRMIHRSSSGSISGAGNRMSMHGDPFGSSGPSQSVEELTAQLHHLMKEKEKLQADLSKIPLSGGGPMTRRKVEMLEEAMDETERAMSKIRYSLRLRS